MTNETRRFDLEDAEPVELGPNSGPRLASMACPECEQTGKLSIWKKMVFVGGEIGDSWVAGEQVKISVGGQMRPVMYCADCGQIAVGEWTTDGYITFRSLEKGQ